MANIGLPRSGPHENSPAGARAAYGHAGASAPVRGAALAAVRGALAAGARLVDLGAASAEAVGAVRAVDPGVIVCADALGADLTRDPDVAERTGAALLRIGAVAGPPGGTAGVIGGRESVLVACEPAEVIKFTELGWAVLVDVDTPELASTLAVAALCAWLGARIIRTRHVPAVRQAVEMVESIRGTRSPSSTRRGLA